jgi:hypothetical protein
MWRESNFHLYKSELVQSFPYKVRVTENSVWRRIFGPKKKEVTVKWRKVHNEELHNLYSSVL